MEAVILSPLKTPRKDYSSVYGRVVPAMTAVSGLLQKAETSLRRSED
jgi:hypothetical protein